MRGRRAGSRFGALGVVLALGAALFGSTPAVAAPPAPVKAPVDLAPHVPGALLVGFRPGTPAADRAAARAAAGALAAEPLSVLASDAEIWTLAAGRSVVGAMTVLARNPVIRYAEPDYLLETAVTSNDPYYTAGNLWGMQGDATSPANAFGSQAAEAWDAGAIGSSSVYIGVIDEGIQYTHPDLDGNIWTNPYDPVDGVDNDGNGFIDDEHGWDFVSNDATIYDAGGDAHGTHVSGTIGGEGGNGIGVAGVNWSVRIISGKFLGSGGGSTSNAVRAVDYMTDLKTRHGLNIVATSNSWGGGGASTALLDAINRGGDAGILFIAAAGNSSSNNDATQNYPSNYQCTTRANGTARGWDCVVAVAAIASTGALASFSSYGANTVDLGAPGVGVVSTVPTDSYASYNGTSMATPHVSGAVALCASLDPSLSAQALRTALLSATIPTASLSGKTTTGGRLDVGGMLTSCAPATAPVSGAPTGLAATAVDARTIGLAWSDGATGETLYEVQRAVSSGTCGSFATVATLGANSTSYTAGGLAASTTYCFRVRAANGFSGGSQSAWSNTASATTAAPPPPYVCAPTAIAWIDPAGGTAYALGDDASATFSIPFAVAAYGSTYTTGVISSNGFLRLGSGSATAYANVAIPNAGDPNLIFAPFWDDLNPGGVSGTVRTKVDGSAPNRRFVATWLNVPHFSVTGSALTFQVVLEEATGDVLFQYLDVIAGSVTYDRGASATVGVEDSTGETGTQISYLSASLADGTAYRCSTNAAAPVSPTIAATTFADGTTGVGYSAVQSASGGVTPYTWSVSAGSLPSGLTLNPSSGAIGGTPSATGTFAFTVKVQGADGGAATRDVSIRVDAPLAISAATLSATAGVAYTQTLATTGGRAPIAWSRSGALPAGVSFSLAGGFSGTPTESGSFPLTITATDDVGRVATRVFTLTVAFGKVGPSNGSRTPLASSATLVWSAHQGATQYRYCVSTAKTCTPSITTSGTTVTVGGLSANKTYYWQVQVLIGSTWVSANGTTFWRFTTAR